MRAIAFVIILLTGINAAQSASEEVPLPERKPDALAADAPSKAPEIPPAWSKAEITQAKKLCSDELAQIPIDYKPLEPIKSATCGNPAPILVKSIGADDRKIEIVPEATLNCHMAAALAKWLKTEVQPAADKHLKSKIIRLRNIASYSCRHRYNDPKKRMSEHAFANALDIAEFETAKPEAITLLHHWGLTQREVRARQEALAKSLAAQSAAKQNITTSPAGQKHLGSESKQALPNGEKLIAPASSKHTWRADILSKQQSSSVIILDPSAKTDKALSMPTFREVSVHLEAPLPKPALEHLPKANSDIRTKAEIDQEKDPRRLFLRGIFTGACAIFSTVLSPESNEAHNNHFHIDLAERKHTAFCQ